MAPVETAQPELLSTDTTQTETVDSVSHVTVDLSSATVDRIQVSQAAVVVPSSQTKPIPEDVSHDVHVPDATTDSAAMVEGDSLLSAQLTPREKAETTETVTSHKETLNIGEILLEEEEVTVTQEESEEPQPEERTVVIEEETRLSTEGVTPQDKPELYDYLPDEVPESLATVLEQPSDREQSIVTRISSDVAARNFA